MTTIVIFDIDGTLTRTRYIDEQSYERALKEVFNIELNAEVRSLLSASADSGFLNDICMHYNNQLPAPDQRHQFQTVFFSHLEQALRQEAKLQIAGAGKLIQTLHDLPNLTVRLATGAWLQSAALKLHHAQITVDPTEVTTADEGLTKHEILDLAHNRVKQSCDATRSYYIGDRHWDYLAAKSLGMGFVGIGKDPLLLEQVSATQCLPDLSSVPDFLKQIAYE
jgi:phosphoglycolate phosphatase-like HAD superfamily hydrolase